MDSSKIKKATNVAEQMTTSQKEHLLKQLNKLSCGVPTTEQQSYYSYVLYKTGYYQRLKKHAN